MSMRLLPISYGGPVYELAAPETFPLPRGFAAGRSIQFQRVGPADGSVVVQAVDGDTLNGEVNGFLALGMGGEVIIRCTDPGEWRSFGNPGGGGIEVVTFEGAQAGKSVVVRLTADGSDVDDIQVGD